ncbi:SAM-dependent methyltransferase [Candidatus Microgenomates bacterium]|nr:SAM-dependent methyltransferase [Candidatus Microgenomates bacterium]
MVESFLILALMLLALFFLLPYLRSGAKFGAPFVPMEREVVSRVMKLAEVGPGKTFYDLGSGDGRLVIAAALRGARAIGVEIDGIRVLYSRFWLKILGLHSAKIVKGNLFEQDLQDADIVSLYLLEGTNEKLKPKLEKELKPGALVVATGFKIPGWKPIKVDPRGPVYGPIYLYRR